MISNLQRVGVLADIGSIRLETAAIPVPNARDVLVRVSVTGICGSDLGIVKSGALAKGTVIGHEFSGVVCALGAEVSEPKVGTPVVVNPMTAAIGLGGTSGSFADYVLVPNAELGRDIFLIPSGMIDEVAALVEPLAVGLHGVARARTGKDDKVIVLGAGPVGLCVVASLQQIGVKQIIVADPSAIRRAAALKLGASAIVDPTEVDVRTFVDEQFGLESVERKFRYGSADVAFECSGIGSAVDSAIRSLVRGGRLVTLADTRNQPIADFRWIMLNEIELLGANGYGDEFSQALSLLDSGAIDLSGLISHRFSLDELEEAFAVQSDPHRSIKVLVRSS